MKNLIFTFLVGILAMTMLSCINFNDAGELDSQDDVLYMFSELDWIEKESKDLVLDDLIQIDYYFSDSIFIYFYMPNVNGYDTSDWESFDYQDVFFTPHYYTNCPINYVEDCEEEYIYAFMDEKISYSSIEDGGYFKFEMPMQKEKFVLGGEDRIYDLSEINITIEYFSDELTNLIVQEGKMLISTIEYSDSKIVSAFE